MIETNKIKTKTSLIGSSNDIIDNIDPGVWNFNGAAIINAIINSAGGFSSMTHSMFVEPNMPPSNVFSPTIGGAITALSEVDNSKSIYIFPGVYNEAISLRNISNLDIIGLGGVNLSFNGLTMEESILIDTCENIRFKNINIVDNGIFHLIETDMNTIKIINSTNCYFNDLNIKMITDGPPSCSFVKIKDAYGPICFDNNNFKLDIRCGVQNDDSHIRFIDYDGTSSEGGLKINNSKFQIYAYKTDPNYKTTVDFIYLLVNAFSQYKYFINNSEFEYQLDAGGTQSNIFFNLFRGVDKYNFKNVFDLIYFFNSFTNVDYHIDIISQNVIKDSNFKILN